MKVALVSTADFNVASLSWRNEDIQLPKTIVGILRTCCAPHPMSKDGKNPGRQEKCICKQLLKLATQMELRMLNSNADGQN